MRRYPLSGHVIINRALIKVAELGEGCGLLDFFLHLFSLFLFLVICVGGGIGDELLNKEAVCVQL